MQIRIGTSRSIVYQCPDHLIGKLMEEFSYTNTSVAYQLYHHKANKYAIVTRLVATGGAMNEAEAGKMWKDQLDEMELGLHPCLVRPTSEGHLVFPTGLLARLKRFFVANGVDEALVEKALVDLRKKPPESVGFPIASPPSDLRPYQKEALETALREGQGTIVAGTGTGKTVVIQELIRHLGLKTLVIVPSLSILGQTERRMGKYFGRHMVGSFSGKKKVPKKMITIACAPSVAVSNPDLWKDVNVLIFDECHHTPCRTIEKIAYGILPNAYYRFGFTATYARGDGATLAIEAASFPPIHTYSVDKGVQDGFLATPRFLMFKVGFDSYKASTSKKPIFAYKNHLIRNTALNKKIIEHIQKFLGQGKQVLVLVREKTHGRLLQKGVPGSVFVRNKGNEKKGEDMPEFVDPDLAVADFNQGKIRCLIGTSIIGEGTDIIPVDVMFNLMGGTSKVSVMQNIGRALRPAPGKGTVWIIDYIYTTNAMLEKHSLKRYNIYKKIGKVDVLDLPK